jgi:hypothetical protein
VPHPQGVNLQQATPAAARRAAAAHPKRCEALVRATQVAPLLRFCLSDLDLSAPAGVEALFGVRLLPLADGASMAGVGPAGDTGRGSSVYVVSEQLELALVGSQGECGVRQ